MANSSGKGHGQGFRGSEAFFGVGSTPLLEGDKLIVMVGAQPNAGVVAFDAQSGKTLWTAVGKGTWDGEPAQAGVASHWAMARP